MFGLRELLNRSRPPKAVHITGYNCLILENRISNNGSVLHTSFSQRTSSLRACNRLRLSNYVRRLFLFHLTSFSLHFSVAYRSTHQNVKISKSDKPTKNMRAASCVYQIKLYCYPNQYDTQNIVGILLVKVQHFN